MIFFVKHGPDCHKLPQQPQFSLKKGSCGHTTTTAIEWSSSFYLPGQPQLSFTEGTAGIMQTLMHLLPPSAATTTRCRPEVRTHSWHHTLGCASSCYSTAWTDRSSPWLTQCWYSCPHPVCWQRWAVRPPWAPSPGRAWQAHYRTRQDGPCCCCLPQI